VAQYRQGFKAMFLMAEKYPKLAAGGANPHIDALPSVFFGFANQGFVVAAAIEHPAYLDSASLRNDIDDGDTLFESRDAQARSQVAPLSSAFRKFCQCLAVVAQTPDILDCPIGSALFGNVEIEPC
jgi:hypothetical protein